MVLILTSEYMLGWLEIGWRYGVVGHFLVFLETYTRICKFLGPRDGESSTWEKRAAM